MHKQVKIGIMGGTFNPIHLGHLLMGECACEQFGLDKVLYMPSNMPPHKDLSLVAPAQDRTRMVELAIKGNSNFELSTIELERQRITYSVDTIRELLNAGNLNQYFFIVGADSLYDLPNWKEPRELLSMVTFLVVSRYGINVDKLQKQIEVLKETYGGDFLIVTVPTIDISSSKIRERISNNQSIRYYVNDEVRTYIYQRELYTNARSL